MPRGKVTKTGKECGSGFKGFCYQSPRRVITFFVHGLVMIIPLAVTIWIIIWLFNLIDGMLAPILTWAFNRPVPGLGFAIIIISVTLIGYFGVKIGHRRLFNFFESKVVKIPGIGSIYGGTRQILTSFTAATESKFLEVVFMEFPRRGIYTVGLVTSECSDRNGKKILNVFIPTAPNPTSGFLQIVPESDVIRTTMTVSDAMKLVISAGKISANGIVDIMQVPGQEDKGAVLKN